MSYRQSTMISACTGGAAAEVEEVDERIYQERECICSANMACSMWHVA